MFMILGVCLSLNHPENFAHFIYPSLASVGQKNLAQSCCNIRSAGGIFKEQKCEQSCRTRTEQRRTAKNSEEAAGKLRKK